MPNESTNLGAMRTMMAADRTLMAWVRTSLSFLSFGFAIYKILQEFQQTGRSLPHENTPRNVALFLAAAGIVAILMGTAEYWLTLRQMQKFQYFRLTRPSLIMALLMCAAGLLLFVAIMTRLL